MKEDFLHYVWKFQKLTTQQLTTTTGAEVQVLKVGNHNQDAGPDFLTAEVSIDQQHWAGHVEIHLKSSDWYAHHHETDVNYDAVILHVVWEHDVDVFRKDNTALPTLELKDMVSKETQKAYSHLFYQTQQWIPCETHISEVDEFILHNWLERLYLERLEQKDVLIQTCLQHTHNDWEAVLFQLLCKNFGLKVNGASFLSIAQSIPFDVIRKCADSLISVEALLLGQAGMLEDKKEEVYYNQLKTEYTFLKQKYALTNESVLQPSFFRLRPPNFPNLRLAQIAHLYVNKKMLFQEVINSKTVAQLQEIFKCEASEFWNTHYNFTSVSTSRKKKVTSNFIELLIINTVIPIKFNYSKHIGKNAEDEIFSILSDLPAESNSIVKRFQTLVPSIKTAWQSQGCLQLKRRYCDIRKCMHCAVGTSLLKAK